MRDGSRLWDYEVFEELGKGEYGQVFKVKNKKDGQFYALKKVNISSCHVCHILLSKNKKSKHSEKSKHSNL
jgi:serine/threonine protein kinase